MTEQTELVQRSQRGDLEAYGELVRRFQDMAVGYAYAVLGDFHLAEDAAQEAFIEAFQSLPRLREPAALASWLRRIVFKHCDRLRRGHRPAVSLEAAGAMETAAHGPADIAERRETMDQVLAAVRGLPDHEREVTALFYINGYSLRDIAGFLDVPEGTVKSRLHASRGRLRERLTTMVEQTLKRHAPDERFSRRVIDALLARPKPLEIEGHPVKQLWDAIRTALPEYEVIEGSEIEDKRLFKDVIKEDLNRAYHVDEERALRTQMTLTTLTAMRGRKPPVRLVAAGRVFRPDPEDEFHLQVFHQTDVLEVAVGADARALRSTLERTFRAIFGPLELRWREDRYPFVDDGIAVDIHIRGVWVEVAGGGLLQADGLRDAGFDPRQVSGFAFGMGLERLAMLKHGIDDIRKLWQPPYIPERPA